MRRSRVLGGAIVPIVAALALAGCGDSSDDASTASSSASTAAAPAATATATTAASAKPVNVAYVTYALTDYVQSELKGVENGVKPGGGSVKLFNANFDPQKLDQQCRDAITSGRYNAILLAPVDGPTGKTCAAAAKAANIPLATIEIPVGDDPTNIEPQVPGVVGVVAGSIPRNSELMTDMTKAACEGKDPCRIIAELAAPTDPVTNAVVKSIQANVPNADIVQKVVGQYDPAMIAKNFADALGAHPDVDVFVSAADSQALAVLPALKKAGLDGKVALIGNGGSRLGAEAIADGTMFGTIGSWPIQSGEAAAKMLTQAVNGETVDPNSVDWYTLDTPVLVDKANVAEFTPEWGVEHG